MFHDYCAHDIRQIYVPATFGSLECWRESWKMMNLPEVMELKRRGQRSEMSSLSMKCRVSSTTGWAILHGLLRMRENILLNKYEIVSSHVVNLKLGGGPEIYFPPCRLNQCDCHEYIGSRYAIMNFQNDICALVHKKQGPFHWLHFLSGHFRLCIAKPDSSWHSSGVKNRRVLRSKLYS
jgi:hypothetical protein